VRPFVYSLSPPYLAVVDHREQQLIEATMLSKPTYRKEEYAATSPTTPFKMIGSITRASLALAAISLSSYLLMISATIANHDASPPLPSSFTSTFVEISPEEVTSSHKQHWSEEAPDWATKEINFRVPKEQEICFAHVGKAGGSTLGCSLGFRLHCDHGNVVDDDDDDDVGDDDAAAQNMNQDHHSSSLLAKLTTHFFHTDVYNCDDDAGYFLFIVRDPIARALSAFNYNKPDESDFINDTKWANQRAHFYSECPFPHMEAFVQNGLREDGDSPDRCKKLAIETLQGTGWNKKQSPDHWYFNYQYYFEAIPSDSKILTVRNKHMEEDIGSIENLFECHEEERLALTASKNTNTWSDEDDLYLSDESISILCQALCNEIQIYKKILHQALNLSQDQLGVSLMELEAKCPHEVIAEECSGVIPDIREKLEDHRGY